MVKNFFVRWTPQCDAVPDRTIQGWVKERRTAVKETSRRRSQAVCGESLGVSNKLTIMRAKHSHHTTPAHYLHPLQH